MEHLAWMCLHMHMYNHDGDQLSHSDLHQLMSCTTTTTKIQIRRQDATIWPREIELNKIKREIE